MIDCSDKVVELVAITGLTILGVAAMVVDGDMGETIAIGVAAAFGFLARHFWGGDGDAEKVQESSNSS